MSEFRRFSFPCPPEQVREVQKALSNVIAGQTQVQPIALCPEILSTSHMEDYRVTGKCSAGEVELITPVLVKLGVGRNRFSYVCIKEGNRVVGWKPIREVGSVTTEY